MGKGEWWSREWGMGNGESGMGKGEWRMGKGEWRMVGSGERWAGELRYRWAKAESMMLRVCSARV
jgi:hypothetical protein